MRLSGEGSGRGNECPVTSPSVFSHGGLALRARLLSSRSAVLPHTGAAGTNSRLQVGRCFQCSDLSHVAIVHVKLGTSLPMCCLANRGLPPKGPRARGPAFLGDKRRSARSNGDGSAKACRPWHCVKLTCRQHRARGEGCENNTGTGRHGSMYIADLLRVSATAPNASAWPHSCCASWCAGEYSTRG